MSTEAGEVHQDPRDRAIVESVLTLGRSQGLSVVAEGVEQPEHLAILHELGCDFGQGFHIARPADLGKVRDLLLADKR
ncbi:MAG: EAL domain-containing protein [Thiohalospira sp.]